MNPLVLKMFKFSTLYCELFTHLPLQLFYTESESATHSSVTAYFSENLIFKAVGEKKFDDAFRTNAAALKAALSKKTIVVSIIKRKNPKERLRALTNVKWDASVPGGVKEGFMALINANFGEEMEVVPIIVEMESR